MLLFFIFLPLWFNSLALFYSTTSQSTHGDCHNMYGGYLLPLCYSRWITVIRSLCNYVIQRKEVYQDIRTSDKTPKA